MKKRNHLSRRKFIKLAVSVAASGSAISCAGIISPWRFLSIEEAKTIEAICEHLVPADQDPGATQAGVVYFFDRQLVGHLKRWQATYREGIAGVDQTSLALFRKKFVDLPPQQQAEVLTALEKNEAPGEIWKRRSAREFFALVVSHTMQGFYGDPRHGGNRDGASWKMLGLPYPPIRGRLQYDLTKPSNQNSA
jgi:gluconate 2-dehydrogenase gamma chain